MNTLLALLLCSCAPDPFVMIAPAPRVVAVVITPPRVVYEEAFPPSAYPVRSNWWTGAGGSRREAIRHLMSGIHAGQFDEGWLNSLSFVQLQSLHSDHHEGRVTWKYVLPGLRRIPPPPKTFVRQRAMSCPSGNCPWSR